MSDGDGRSALDAFLDGGADDDGDDETSSPLDAFLDAGVRAAGQDTPDDEDGGQGFGIELDLSEVDEPSDEPASPVRDEPLEWVGDRADAGPPPLAITQTGRAARDVGRAATEEVDALLQAAGLDSPIGIEVTLTTADGRWVVLEPGGSTRIGRGRDCDLTVDDATVSRHHCRVTRTADDTIVVEDLASANGTWIHRGEQRLDLSDGGSDRVHHGDWLRTGPETQLVHVGVERTSGRDGAGRAT